jgi:transcriptional regulator GlxA family with amidase domain
VDVASATGGDKSFRDWAPGNIDPLLEAGPADVHLSDEVRCALEHMMQNYADSITLKDISALIRRSPSQIIRAFHRELGTTPHAWLIRLRVSLGMAMLRRGDSIANVAYEVGFVDQAHFTRHFKRGHGKTPGRFLSAAPPAMNRR